MTYINTVIMIGRLTKDPESDFTNGGSQRCRIRIACDNGMLDDKGNSAAEFFNVEVWNKQAVFVQEHFHKGKEIALTQAKLSQQSWEDKTTGDKRERVLITAFKVDFVGSKGQQPGHEEDAAEPEEPKRKPANAPQQQQPAQRPPTRQNSSAPTTTASRPRAKQQAADDDSHDPFADGDD